MSIKSVFGLDGVELAIHAAVTGVLLTFTATFNRPDEAMQFFALTAVSSLVLLSIRRRLALRKAEPKRSDDRRNGGRAHRRAGRADGRAGSGPGPDGRAGGAAGFRGAAPGPASGRAAGPRARRAEVRMRMSDPGELALFLALGSIFVTVLAGPIGQAIARRISRGKGADPATGLTTGEMTAERMAALEDRIAELEAERGQLEERLDFAERMLTRGNAEPRKRALGRLTAEG